MAIKHLLVGGQSLRKLQDYDVALEPLWASDAGRSNLSGTFTGTFNGYYASITLFFTPMWPEDFSYNSALLQNKKITITFENPETKQYVTRDFYGTAISSKVSRYDGKYGEFSINLVAMKKM